MLGWFKSQPQRTLEVVLGDFEVDCDGALPNWEAYVGGELAQERDRAARLRKRAGATESGEDYKPLTRREIEANIAPASTVDLDNLKGEMDRVQNLTHIVLGACAIVLGILGERANNESSSYASISLTAGGVLVFAALVIAVLPLHRKFKRTWRHPYDSRFHRNLLATTDFKKYVLNSKYGNRLAPVITIYKKALSIAAPCLVAGIVLGLGIAPNV